MYKFYMKIVLTVVWESSKYLLYELYASEEQWNGEKH